MTRLIKIENRVRGIKAFAVIFGPMVWSVWRFKNFRSLVVCVCSPANMSHVTTANFPFTSSLNWSDIQQQITSSSVASGCPQKSTPESASLGCCRLASLHELKRAPTGCPFFLATTFNYVAITESHRRRASRWSRPSCRGV